jgi:hypothetical protein
MKQLNFIKQLKTVIAICIMLLAFVVFNGCNNSSSDSTEVKDSTTTINTMPDTSTISTDTLPKFDSLQNRSDTGRGDQTPPPPR